MSVQKVTRLLSCSVLFWSLSLVPVSGQPTGAGDPVPDPMDPEDAVTESEAVPDTGAVPDSVLGKWMYSAGGRLNFSQAAYKDWEEGAGNNSLALATELSGQVAQRGQHWIQAHELRLAFGVINQAQQELRKAEDQIRWNSSIRYEGDDFFRLFNPTIAANLRTQFAKGFDYSSNPFEGEVDSNDPRLDLEPPVETSAFFAPAFITESLGLTYEPITDFTLRVGAAAKQTIVRERDFRVLYGVNEDNLARVEAGVEFASSFDRQLTDDIRYRSQLNVFFSFNQTEDPPDALWENTVELQVNSWLSTNLQFVALYDTDISNVIQLKETVSVGLVFSII